MNAFKNYYRLTKPGIIYGNLVSTSAGFFFATRGDFQPSMLLATLSGVGLVIASACVFNNFLDKDVDALMSRTKLRSLVKREISDQAALVFASILGLIGFLLLYRYTNAQTLIAGAIGFFFYVVLYGYWKRRSVFGTEVGSVAGAMPIVAGYTSVSGRFDTGALLVFLIMVSWQMPHFYAIAVYRMKEYLAANIPLLPIKMGIWHTKIRILLYIIVFTIIAALPTFFGFTGYIYLAAILVVGSLWFGFGFKNFNKENDILWARKMFLISLGVMISFSVLLSAGPLLP